jgi:hypothetical protein
MKQVITAGGDPFFLMEQGRETFAELAELRQLDKAESKSPRDVLLDS